MNPQVFIDAIEQAVGPVRARGTRKDRMREELAAHLAASWEEERARNENEADSAERAVRRLGDIAELSLDLQESVPRIERWFFTPLPFLGRIDDLDRALRRKDPETPFRHAMRIAIGMTTAIAAVDLVVVPVSTATQAKPRSDWSTIALWAIASLMVCAVGSMVFTLLWEATIRALQGANKSRRRVALYMALSSLFVIGLGLGFILIVSLGGHQETLFRWSDWPRLLVGSLFAPPLLVYAARDERERRRIQNGWGIAETLA